MVYDKTMTNTESLTARIYRGPCFAVFDLEPGPRSDGLDVRNADDVIFAWLMTQTLEDVAGQTFRCEIEEQGEVISRSLQVCTPPLYGALVDYESGEMIRPATADEQEASEAQAKRDGGRGLITDETGRTVYVDDDWS